VAFSPNGRLLATASFDQTARLWDTRLRRPPDLLQRPRGEGGFQVHCVAFSPDSTILAWNADKVVKLCDVATCQELATFTGHRASVSRLAFSPDGRMLASAGADGTLKLWDVASRREVATLPKHTDAISSVAFSPDGKTLATGSNGGPIRLWNVATRQELMALERPGWYAPIAFSPDGQYMASGSGSDDRSVLLWRAASFAETDAPAGTRLHSSSP
jgi:WD40 repeat protein